jgi:nifR3 family TIM-barrel protein
MKIGGITLKNPLILAPMAGITHLPFRRLAKEAGCGLVVTEMVSANGLVHKSGKTAEILAIHPDERPVSAQIFGTDPDVMGEAAQIVEGMGADILDINLGCSVRKIVRQGAGAALMREPDKLKALFQAVRRTISIPATVKMRTGWDRSGDQAIRAARLAQDTGFDAVAIHPRTATQGFGGDADWSLIARMKKSISIPVIGNGDIRAPQDVLKMQEETGCDSVMIGRTCIGNPWIFSQTLSLIDGRNPTDPDLSERLDTVLRYIDYAVEHFGETRALFMMRSQLAWFTKGLPHSSRFRAAIVHLKSKQAMIEVLQAYFDSLQTPTEPA